MVKQFIKVAILAFGLGVGAAQTAAAGGCPPNDTACVVAGWQATRQPYRGPLDGRLALACVRLLASSNYANMTEVVLVVGSDPVNGRVITSLGLGNGHSFQMKGQPAGTDDVYVREFCFNPKLIQGYDTVTFCNGFNRGDGNHHTLSLRDESAPYLRNLLRTGHVGNFLSLLGTKRTYTGPVPAFFNAKRYGGLYGRDGRWQY